VPVVAVFEDHGEHALLDFREIQHLAEEHRAERRDRRAHLNAAVAGEAEELDRKRLGRMFAPRVQAIIRFARKAHPGEIALHVREEHRHAGAGEVLREELQRARFSRAGGAGDHPVPIHHPQRNAHRQLGRGRAFAQDGADVERRVGEGVRGAVGFVEGHRPF